MRRRARQVVVVVPFFRQEEEKNLIRLEAAQGGGELSAGLSNEQTERHFCPTAHFVGRYLELMEKTITRMRSYKNMMTRRIQFL